MRYSLRYFLSPVLLAFWALPCTAESLAQYGYTAREPDASGLVYLRSRAYDPSLDRFTQRDPIGLAGGLGDYAYVDGKPIDATDPSGLTPSLGPSGLLGALLYYITPGDAAAAAPRALPPPRFTDERVGYRVDLIEDQFRAGLPAYPNEIARLASVLGLPANALPFVGLVPTERTALTRAGYLSNGLKLPPQSVFKMGLPEGVEAYSAYVSGSHRYVLVPAPMPPQYCEGCFQYLRILGRWEYFANPWHDPQGPASPDEVRRLAQPGNGADLFLRGVDNTWGTWLRPRLRSLFGSARGGGGGGGANMIHDDSLAAMEHLAIQRYAGQLHDAGIYVRIGGDPWTIAHPFSGPR